MKKLTIHYDAVAVLVLVLIISLSMNFWQYKQVGEATQTYVDSEWQAQNVKSKLLYTRILLKQCDPEKYANLDVRE